MLLKLAAPYLAVALCAAVHTTGSLRRVPTRRGAHLDRIELAFLWVVALVASILWIVFLPVFARGWLRTRVPRMLAAVRARLDARGGARRARVRVPRALPRPAASLPASAGEGDGPPQWLLRVSGGSRSPVAALLPPSSSGTPVVDLPTTRRLRRRRSAG